MKKKISNEVQEVLEQEIKDRKKLPNESKNKRDNKVFRNLLFAVFVVMYFILLNIGYFSIEKTIYINDTIIFSLMALVAAITLFEIAYKNEKGYLAIHGIEILTVAIFTYFIPYTYFNTDEFIIKLIMCLPAVYAVYYCIKAIVIWIIAKKDKKNDIKDIVKKEEKNEDDVLDGIDKDKEANEEALETEETPSKEEKKVSKTKQTAKKEKKVAKKETTNKKEERTKKNTTASAKKSNTASATKTTAKKKTDSKPKTEKTAKKTTKTTKTTKVTKAKKSEKIEK